MVHHLNLSPHIFIVLFAQKLALWDGFAGVVVACGLFGTQVGGAKLTLPKDLAQRVEVSEVLGLVG